MRLGRFPSQVLARHRRQPQRRRLHLRPLHLPPVPLVQFPTSTSGGVSLLTTFQRAQIRPRSFNSEQTIRLVGSVGDGGSQTRLHSLTVRSPLQMRPLGGALFLFQRAFDEAELPRSLLDGRHATPESGGYQRPRSVGP